MEKYDEALDQLKEAMQFLNKSLKSAEESLEAALSTAQQDTFWELIGWGNSAVGIQRFMQCTKCSEFPRGSLQFVCSEGHLTCTNCGCENVACSYILDEHSCRSQLYQSTVTLAQKTISGYFLKKGEQENSSLAVATIPGGIPVPAEATPADAPEPEITTPFYLQVETASGIDTEVEAEPQAEIASVSEPKSEITTGESRSHGEIVTETVPVVEVDYQPEIATTEASVGEIATTEASGETAPVEDEIASAPAKDPQPEIATTEASGEIAPVEVEIASTPAEDPQPKIATVEINGGIEIEPQAKTAPGDTLAQTSASHCTAEVPELEPSQNDPQLDEKTLQRTSEKLGGFQEKYSLTVKEIVHAKKLAYELYSPQGPDKLKEGFVAILAEMSHAKKCGHNLLDADEDEPAKHSESDSD